VLDEPNSNLDESGEKALVDAVRVLKEKTKTVVLITHRKSTLAACDKILVLSEGTLAAFGPRDEVLKALQGQPPAPPPQRRAPPTVTFTPLPP
jgi:ATP-binding cassette subfamily C exporter for protease/lipase